MSLSQENSLPEGIKTAISWRVRSGFYTTDEVVADVAGQLSDEQNIPGSEARRKVRPFMAEAWSAQHERETSWPPGPTVCDRLTKAFGSLQRRHGIIAKMNFTCCQSCATSEIGEDADGDDTFGFVYFHEQDTEAAVDTGLLRLGFGSFTKSRRKNESVGNTIVRSLKRAGLKVSWEGDARKRIEVKCGEWRRRACENEDHEDVFDDDFESDSVSEGDGESGPEPDTQSDLSIDPDEG